MNFKAFLLFIGSVFYISASHAQWSSNTAINTSVAIAVKSQQNIHSVTDAKNGVITAWDDNRNNLTNSTDIFAQRLNSDGVAKWTASGVAVCTSTGTQRSVNMVEDGNGGAILTWEDNRSGNYDIYAQKIDSNGVAQWTTDGVIITNGLTNQKNPKIIDDLAGGAIIVWEDSVNFYFDIYAQRINAAGTVVWATNGIPICTSPNIQNNPKIDNNGFGGAVITWQDKRTNIDYDIYAQNINSAGTILWATDGVLVCNAPNTQNNPRIEPDGFGGAVIAWADKRFALDYDIYAQRLDGFGAAQWTTNGIIVCNAANNQSGLDIKYLGSNGVALSWKDMRSGTYNIYTQIISLSGTALLAVNGLQISNSLLALNPNNIADGTGGVIVAWEDSSAAGFDIKSQKISSSGALKWLSGGATITNAAYDQINVSQVYDGKGGAIYLWEDKRNTLDYDIYAQHADSSGLVGIYEFQSNDANVNLYPNPSSGEVQINLNSRSIPAYLEFLIVDITGNLVFKHAAENSNSISLDLNGKLSSGLYFYTLTNKENHKSYHGKLVFGK